MKNKPILIRFIKGYGNEYEIKFPSLKKPLTVSRYYYEHIVNSPEEFKFI